MNVPVRDVWIVSREYAGIAEAGGVKNVACSLAEGLVRSGREVFAFVPRYGCVSLQGVPVHGCTIRVARQSYRVRFLEAALHGVRIVLVDAPIFSQKKAVYVYTGSEPRTVPGAVRGKGHADVDIMNVLFCRSVIEYARHAGKGPDVLHCQDAHTALLPPLIRSDGADGDLFRDSRMIVTIHNAGPGYRQTIAGLSRAALLTGMSEQLLSGAYVNGQVEPFLLAAPYAELTTVSPWYAEELVSQEHGYLTGELSAEFASRGISITGITNGIDADRYDPRDTSRSLLPYAFDPASGELTGKYLLRAEYGRFADAATQGADRLERFGSLDPSPHAVYYAYHGRIAWQKGLDVLEKAARIVLDQCPEARFAVLGQGDPVIESLLVRMAQQHPGRFMYVRGYERSLARMTVAMADFLVLPSFFEPCGLEDYIGQIFGTLPVAHAVGGLKKIRDGETGFLYPGSTDVDDARVLARLLLDLSVPIVSSPSEGCAGVPRYLGMIRRAALYVREACNWDSIIAERYLPLYEKK